MVEFKLEAWEWPQGWEKPYLIEPFETDFLREIGIERATICAILYKDNNYDMGLIFYRPHAPGADNYIFCGQHDHTWPSWAGKTFLWPIWLDPDEGWKEIEESCQQGDIEQWVGARLFHLEKSFCLIRGTVGYWAHALDNIRDHSTLFNLPFDSEQVSSAELWQWLQTQFADPNSEVHRTYRWNLQTWDENCAYYATLPWIREQEHIMSLIAHREIPSGYTCHWYLSDPAHPPRISCFPIHSYSLQLTEKLESRLRLWSQILGRHFLWFQFDETSTPECIVRDYDSYSQH